MKITPPAFKALKGNEKITVLTAYDYPTAKFVDEAGIDAILVGDSLGMVCLGYPDTVPVTMEEMLHHTAAAARGTENALVIADMPFLSYQVCIEEAIFNAGRFIKEARADCVKLEGGTRMAATVEAIVNAGIPVMGHIGLTPQTASELGGFKVQGKSDQAAAALVDDARALEEAGAFSIVIECVPAAVAERVTEAISIPTIGIGAGAGCDGQVLVLHDMVGLFDRFLPKFVKRYAQLSDEIKKAAQQYIKEVKAGEFPAQEHTF
jgi:3-methyl-2-oxobutanoate hydroxymethyltransferase